MNLFWWRDDHNDSAQERDDYAVKKQTVLTLSHEMEQLAGELRRKARNLKMEIESGR